MNSQHTVRRASTMTSVLQNRYGAEPEAVLRVGEAAVPTVGDDEVLVRVRAASVDRGTWHLMAGLAYPIRLVFGLRRPRFANPGRNLAGTVEAVGAGGAGVPGGGGGFGGAAGKGTVAGGALRRPDRRPGRTGGPSLPEGA